jgi:hypothetical protein
MRILRLHEVKQIPKARQLTPEELREAYALAKAAFTADDLYHCIEEEEGLPMEDLLKEMEENQKKVERKNP